MMGDSDPQPSMFYNISLEKFVPQEHPLRRIRPLIDDATIRKACKPLYENQLALGESEVVAALARLRSEGLTRHDVVHAIGHVLATTMNEGLAGSHGTDLNAPYVARLRSLTAERWLEQQLE
jgi:hypothetical protein